MNTNIPSFIDNAQVLYWAWAGELPFGFVADKTGNDKIAVFALALCQYKDSHQVYRFSCNKQWESLQDDVYESIEEAMLMLPQQYQVQQVDWHKK